PHYTTDGCRRWSLRGKPANVQRGGRINRQLRPTTPLLLALEFVHVPPLDMGATRNRIRHPRSRPLDFRPNPGGLFLCDCSVDRCRRDGAAALRAGTWPGTPRSPSRLSRRPGRRARSRNHSVRRLGRVVSARALWPRARVGPYPRILPLGPVPAIHAAELLLSGI